MRAVGIIAEYNPFHSGHAYHLREAKRKSGADFAVVVMSPDFVQRGEPAVFDKYTRTEMALLNGADLVLELPVCYAAGSAEYFAQGAVSVLDGLKAVDALCFGCEVPELENTVLNAACGNDTQPDIGTAYPDLFWKTAKILNQEPETFKAALRFRLADGTGFARARADAVQEYLQKEGDGAAFPEQFFELPNNILGIEYCRAILKFCPQMKIIPIARVGSGYHDSRIQGPFCSAFSLRKVLLPEKDRFGRDSIREICGCIPPNLYDIYASSAAKMVTSDDLLPYLQQKLLFGERYDDILDISGDLSDRIRRLRFACIGKNFEEITEILMTKHMTRSRIRRALLHLILEIDAAQTERFRADGPAYYAKVLGFRREAAPLLHEIKKRGNIPLLAKNADAAGKLTETGRAMLRQDFKASHLYRGIRALKYGTHFRSEYEMSPVVLQGNSDRF